MRKTFPDEFDPLNVGVDLVLIKRFEEKLENRKFFEKLFTVDELRIAEDRARKAEYFAGRWAAKEAVAKALGCGFGENLGFKEVEVLADVERRPYVLLSEEAYLRHHHPRFHISISHEGDYAIAMVILKR
ncbi:holo-ACP synthase [bacterium]|nr:holo-ACP synthase [bacterium]